VSAYKTFFSVIVYIITSISQELKC